MNPGPKADCTLMSSRNPWYPAATLACLLAGVALPGAAVAAQDTQSDMELAIRAGLAWSDNLALSAANENSGGNTVLGVVLSRRDSTRRLDSTIDVNLGYLTYLDNEFNDQLMGGAAIDAQLGLVPDVLEWFVRDNYAQIRSNALAADNPDNWIGVNYLTTGPRLTLAFNPSTALRLESYYARDSYGESVLDSTRYGGSAGLSRQTSSVGTASLNIAAERRRFDDQPPELGYNPSYTTRSAALNYTIAAARTDFTVDVGYSEVDVGASKSGGVLARLSVARQLTPSATLRIGLNRSFSDSSDSLRNGQSVNGVSPDTDLSLATSDVFLQNAVQLQWDYIRNRTTFGITADYSDDEYERQTILNRTLTRYGFFVIRQMTRTLSLRAGVDGTLEQFQSLGITTNEISSDVALTWNPSGRLAWMVQYGYRSRNGDGLAASYTENRGAVSLYWTPLVRR